jgi:alpha-D-ribose 1-methylphosphonate 5-triphosphate diphosphatase
MTDASTDVRVKSAAFASRSIVLRDRVVAGTIHLENGRIAGIEEDHISHRAENWGDDHIIPGLIELHTDHLEPHYAPRPRVFWDPLAAVVSYDAQIASSGITTVFDSFRAGSDGDRSTLGTGLHELAKAVQTARNAGMLRVEHRTHLRCEICAPDVLDEAERFLADYDVGLMSLMDHTPGLRQYRDESKWRTYYRGKTGRTEAELDVLVAERRAAHSANHDRHRNSLVAMAKRRNVRLASHDDTTIEHVTESKMDGISVAEFPTTLEAASALHGSGIAVMMGAPNVVRGGSHSGNIAARDLVERGLLDILSSDYVPGSLLQAAFMLSAIPSVGGLPGALALVTSNPARVTGLTDRGVIAAGQRADLVRVNLTKGLPVVREVYSLGRRVA